VGFGCSRAAPGAPGRRRLPCGDREGQRLRRRIEREPSAPWGVVARGDEEAHLLAARHPQTVMRGADDGAHLGGHHMTVGMDRYEQRPALEREAHAAPGGGGAGRGAQAQGFAFELQ
jgi:hypothetical protein